MEQEKHGDDEQHHTERDDQKADGRAGSSEGQGQQDHPLVCSRVGSGRGCSHSSELAAALPLTLNRQLGIARAIRLPSPGVGLPQYRGRMGARDVCH